MTINIWQDFLSQPIYEARLYESFTRKDPPSLLAHLPPLPLDSNKAVRVISSPTNAPFYLLFTRRNQREKEIIVLRLFPFLYVELTLTGFSLRAKWNYSIKISLESKCKLTINFARKRRMKSTENWRKKILLYFSFRFTVNYYCKYYSLITSNLFECLQF